MLEVIICIKRRTELKKMYYTRIDIDYKYYERRDMDYIRMDVLNDSMLLTRWLGGN